MEASAGSSQNTWQEMAQHNSRQDLILPGAATAPITGAVSQLSAGPSADTGEPSAVEVESEAAEPSLRHRILQSDGRRYSLKLEPAFWTSLEAAAKRRNLRLSQLIRDIALEPTVGSSLSARLRQFCLEEAESLALRLESRMETQIPTSDSHDLVNIVAVCPLPCIVVSATGRINRTNEAFGRWMNADPKEFLGKPVDHYFQLRLPVPLAGMAAQALKGGSRHCSAKIAFVAPGRVVVAKARICLFGVRNPIDFSYLVMIQTDARE
jgi:predicted DNA-binding ribbon-helix-helix protein